MKCTMKKIAGVIALTAMLSTVALPVFAAESATGGINVTYKANSATTDKADWLVSYPKTVTVSDYNNSIPNGVSLDFKLLDKVSATDPYTGSRKVSVTIDEYNKDTGINMTDGTSGTAFLGMAVSGTELSSGQGVKIVELSQASASGAATAFLKSTDKAEGAFNANVSFTFTDDSTGGI